MVAVTRRRSFLLLLVCLCFVILWLCSASNKTVNIFSNGFYFNEHGSEGNVFGTLPQEEPNGLRQYFPGRLNQTSYHNLTINVVYSPNSKAEPHQKNDCAPGLICQFSDKSWHETAWHGQRITFANSHLNPNAIAVSMESHSLSPGSVTDGSAKDFAGFATSDLRSDVPVTYMDMGGEGATARSISSYYKRPKSAEIKVWKIFYMQSNCNNVNSGRRFVVQKLIDRGLVDSYGKCNHNSDLPTDHVRAYGPHGNKTALMERYAFVAAFENSYYPGYATEKVWDPLWVGSLPIYLGAPDAPKFLPENSFIDVNDFTSLDGLADHIEYLIRNRTAYDNYHKWRLKPVPKNLKELWEFSEQPFECRVCRWGAEHLY